MGKGPDGSDGIRFRFTRRREGEGKRDEKEQRGDQIGSCVSFRAAGSHRNLSVGYVAYLVCQPISLSGPDISRPPEASCAPGIRRSASPDPSLDRNRSLIHRHSRAPESGHIICRPFTRPLSVTLLGCNRFPPSAVHAQITHATKSITCSQ
jgi:hypothetical protein